MMKVLSIEIFMFLVSVAAGVGSGDGVGDVALALGLPPHATTSRPAAMAARNDLSILKV